MPACRLFGVSAGLFGVLAGLAAGAALAAEPPVALALEVAGTTAVAPFDELSPGQTISLGGEGRIEFLHYGTCQSVIVEGGDLSFTDQRFTARGGRVVDMQRAGCPTEVVLGPGAGIAGAVLRSGGAQMLRLATRPAFVLVGEGRDGWEALRLTHGSEVVAEVPVSAGEFAWPDNAPALEAGAGYSLTLLPGGEREPLTVEVEIVERRGTPPTTLLRTD